MPNFTITINFPGISLQDSVEIGDVAYYVYPSEDGGFEINYDDVVEIGPILSINNNLQVNGLLTSSIVCETELYGNQLEIGCNRGREGGCGDPFILFSKNNCQQARGMLGYYAMFKFKNNSTTKAELFNVTVDAFESSK